MKNNTVFYKKLPTDKVSWVDNSPTIGEFLFSFDRKKIYNLFRDYPHNMSDDEVKIFDKENPQWAEFFKDRKHKTITEFKRNERTGILEVWKDGVKIGEMVTMGDEVTNNGKLHEQPERRTSGGGRRDETSGRDNRRHSRKQGETVPH